MKYSFIKTVEWIKLYKQVSVLNSRDNTSEEITGMGWAAAGIKFKNFFTNSNSQRKIKNLVTFFVDSLHVSSCKMYAKEIPISREEKKLDFPLWSRQLISERSRAIKDSKIALLFSFCLLRESQTFFKHIRLKFSAENYGKDHFWVGLVDGNEKQIFETEEMIVCYWET